MARAKQPANKQPENNQTKPEAQVMSAQWAGPLPPPRVLESFGTVVENGAERIFRMAEKEQEHRISYERAELDAMKTDFRRGQIIGAVLAALCVAASIYSVILGAHPAVSIALVGIPIMALIGKILKK
ncbi:DUF2335 domain-containing protein [Kerstersia gyiorum]|uniref:DUF2335 domain-containing protein n=1 Tax=Kerstersia gyiorum TaxID=206506 RepID=UPI00214FD6E1|nr:DUF2335 domain-containing protein [Kerstersia gyiorum]MCR4158799.1 DUF2335 domain-containing protein [Kerstersia gyiorum]